MIKNKLLIIWLFVSATAMAQVPGYQGLKFSVKYDLGFMHPIFEGRRGVEPLLYHNLSLDYVITRDLSVGVKYGLMFYNQQPNHVAMPTYYEGSTSFNPADYTGRYTQHTVSFILKKFFRRSGYIAPVGRYLLFGIFYQYAIDKSTTMAYSSYMSVYTPSSFKGIANAGGLMFGIGRNFIVANRMVIDVGCEFNIPVAPIIGPGGTLDKRVTYADIFYNNCFQVYLGLGVLAF